MNAGRKTCWRPLRHRLPVLETLESRTLLSAGAIIHTNLFLAASSQSSVGGYTPAQMSMAYGFTGVSDNGAGQTIAIVDAYNDPNIAADLSVFDKQFGLPAANLSVVNQSGKSARSVATDAGWAGEISLDVEWAHAMAPGAKILLVEANSSSLSDLMTAVNYARDAAGVSVVSMSWGGSEFSGQTSYDSYFTTPAGHQGVTFVAAAGDNTAAAAEWPASSPNVLAVGGTTLNLTSSGGYLGESAWSSGGGGISQVESAPTYQLNAQNTGARTVPDVAYNADPYTGFAVYDSINDQGYVGWQVVGGTSAGAPQWSAIIALADQARVAAGKGTLDGATGTLPSLYNLYNNASIYNGAFNDITTGASGYYYGPWFIGQGAGPGYDGVTGLGTPKVATVVADLASASPSGVSATETNARARHRARHRVNPVLSTIDVHANNAATISAATVVVPTPLVSALSAVPHTSAIAESIGGHPKLAASTAQQAIGSAASHFIGVAEAIEASLLSSNGPGGSVAESAAAELLTMVSPAPSTVGNIVEAALAAPTVRAGGTILAISPGELLTQISPSAGTVVRWSALWKWSLALTILGESVLLGTWYATRRLRTSSGPGEFEACDSPFCDRPLKYDRWLD